MRFLGSAEEENKKEAEPASAKKRMWKELSFGVENDENAERMMMRAKKTVEKEGKRSAVGRLLFFPGVIRE